MSFAAFDPDRFVTAAPDGASAEPVGIPDAWSHGLSILVDRAPPLGACRDRWAQIVTDAVRFAAQWGAEAVAHGWTLGEVFGFDPDQPESFIGLVIDIRGGRVLGINDRAVTIKHPGRVHLHHRHMPADSAPLWAFRGRI